jgi:hypothetical protein
MISVIKNEMKSHLKVKVHRSVRHVTLDRLTHRLQNRSDQLHKSPVCRSVQLPAVAPSQIFHVIILDERFVFSRQSSQFIHNMDDFGYFQVSKLVFSHGAFQKFGSREGPEMSKVPL